MESEDDVKTIVIGNTTGLAHGKTAIVTALTRADTYRVGTDWLPAIDAAHDTRVDEVNHFGRHTMAVGDVVLAESLDGPTVKIEILGIRAVEVDRLSPDDFRALGYEDRAAYDAEMGEVFGARVWWMTIRRLNRLLRRLM